MIVIGTIVLVTGIRRLRGLFRSRPMPDTQLLGDVSIVAVVVRHSMRRSGEHDHGQHCQNYQQVAEHPHASRPPDFVKIARLVRGRKGRSATPSGCFTPLGPDELGISLMMSEKQEQEQEQLGGKPPRLLEIASVFARYANFTLGGGSATTAVMHGQLVTKRGWLSDETFTLCFALGRLTPGTNVLAFCTGVGWLLRRLPGALVALLAASIPCTLMVVVLTALFREWQDATIAKVAIHGAVAAAVAITAKTSWTIARPIYRGGGRGARMRVVMIGGAAFGLYAGFGVPAIYVLLLAGLVGATLTPVRR